MYMHVYLYQYRYTPAVMDDSLELRVTRPLVIGQHPHGTTNYFTQIFLPHGENNSFTER